jgi:divinyl chlorophyllide a 8-vinyl-reductase
VLQKAQGNVSVRASYRDKAAKDTKVAVFGSTGYIGKKVTQELVSRGFDVIPVARERSGIKGAQSKKDVEKMFKAARCKFADVQNQADLEKVVFDEPVDVAVCCLASRTGGIKDSWAIDYQVCSAFRAMHCAMQSLWLASARVF